MKKELRQNLMSLLYHFSESYFFNNESALLNKWATARCSSPFMFFGVWGLTNQSLLKFELSFNCDATLSINV